MRILQVHWTFPPTAGGVESHVADLSAGLAARGCDVTVLTGEPRPEQWPGVTVVRSELLHLVSIRNGRAALDGYHEAVRHDLDRLINNVRPEVVHGHNLHHFTAAPALTLDALAGRYGFRMHHTFHETWPDLLHENPAYRRWSGNYAVSRHISEECAMRIGFVPELRPLGVDTVRFQTHRVVLSGSDDPVILHPARLLPWKGVHVSVQMLSLLRRRGVSARLVLTDTARIADWDGELAKYRHDILAMVSELGLGDSVDLRGVSYRDMPALYEEADVVVYPTVAAEPYGLVPIEAMSARRPVVASRCGGIPETMVDGVTGWLVDPDNVEGLAARVAQVLSDPARARRMGEAGRRRACSEFDLQRYINDMLHAYRVASMAK
jgi:glycosyltransferase involved in cell wall biosynthesis